MSVICICRFFIFYYSLLEAILCIVICIRSNKVNFEYTCIYILVYDTLTARARVARLEPIAGIRGNSRFMIEKLSSEVFSVLGELGTKTLIPKICI